MPYQPLRPNPQVSPDAETAEFGPGVPTAGATRLSSTIAMPPYWDQPEQAGWNGTEMRQARRLRFLSPAALCDSVTRTLFWIAGADERHMRGRKKERYLYQLIGFSVVLTAIAAVVGMVLFLRLSVPGSWPRDIAIGMLWGTFIFWLDRWLVTRTPYGPLDATNDGSEPRGKGRFIGYAGRVLLGLLLAITISGPIVLALFAPEINQQLVVNQNADKSAAAETIRGREDFVKRRAEINDAAKAAETTEQAKNVALKSAQDALDAEISGRGGTGEPGCASECVQKREVVKAAQADAATATAAAIAARNKAQADLAALETDINLAVTENNVATDESAGAFARERALFDVLRAHPVLYGRWAAITGLLLLVDVMPILSKLLSSNTLHDRNIRLDVATRLPSPIWSAALKR